MRSTLGQDHLPPAVDAGAADAAQPRLLTWRQAAVLGGLGLLCVAAFAATLVWGSVSVPLGEVIGILRGQEPRQAAWTAIVWELRLPRALVAVLAGVALALSGLALQTLFRNALAEPYVLGVSAGASLGAGLVLLPQGATGFAASALATLGPLAGVGVVAAAAAGALAVLGLMVALASRVRNIVIVLVAGIMVAAFLTAVTNVLMYFARPEALVAFTAWQLGSFQGVGMAQLPVLAGAVGVGVLLVALGTKQFNASLLGERYAASLGLSVRGFRVLALTATALLAGAVTAYCGPIGFLGIAAPHLARGLLATSDHRLLVPGSALVGAAVALAAGLFAQLPGSDALLPLNATMALIGAPVVLRVLLRINRTGEGFAV